MFFKLSSMRCIIEQCFLTFLGSRHPSLPLNDKLKQQLNINKKTVKPIFGDTLALFKAPRLGNTEI